MQMAASMENKDLLVIPDKDGNASYGESRENDDEDDDVLMGGEGWNRKRRPLLAPRILDRIQPPNRLESGTRLRVCTKGAKSGEKDWREGRSTRTPSHHIGHDHGRD